MWSRIGQRQSSCLCRACLHAPKTVARRSTTAATRRRKVTATDLFTACYTTILGTAAIIDAQNKEFRKQDLDNKLEKARAAVNNLAAQNAALLSDVSPPNSEDQSPWLDSPAISQLARPDFSQQCLAIYGEKWRQFGPKSLPLDRVDWLAIEKAIAAENHDPQVRLIEPNSDRGIYRATKSVIALVDELIAKVETQGDGKCHEADTTATIVSTNQEQQLWQDMKEARNNGQLPIFESADHDPEGAAKTRSSLRESFILAIDGATTHRGMVAKICYNLLVSTIPPTITIYNTLIAGFHRIQRPDLAQSVVNSILKRSVGPDTPATTLCFLSHFRSTENAEGVRTVARRMRGGDGKTLYLNTLQESARNFDALKGGRHDQDEKPPQVFVKTSPIDKACYDALIVSWLSIGEIDRATKKFIECLRHNIHTDARSIAQLFENCAFSAEGRIARKLVKGLAKHLENFLGMIQRLMLEIPAGVMLGVMDSLYRILEVSFDTSVIDYGLRLKELQKFTTTFKPWVSRWRVQLQTRLAISETREMLQHFSLDQPLCDRVDAALKCLTFSSSFEDPAIWSRGAKLSAMQSELDTLQTKGTKLSAQIRALIIKHKTDLDFDPWGDLESPRWSDRHRRLAITDALEQVTLQTIMTAEDVKEELVAKFPDPQQAEAFTIAGIGRFMGIGILTRFYGPEQRELASSKLKIEVGPTGASKLEAEIDTQIRITKAILYGGLWGHAHRILRWQYPDWDEIPIELLVEKHLRRCVRLASPAKPLREVEVPLLEKRTAESQHKVAMPSRKRQLWQRNTAPRGKGLVSTKIKEDERRELTFGQRYQDLAPVPYRLAATA